jgi:hypothetical protein
MKRAIYTALTLALMSVALDAQVAERTPPSLSLPNAAGSVKFLALGDSGTGTRMQYELANQMAAYKSVFPFDFAILLGDNIYGNEQPIDFKKKFEEPYKPLISGGVNFYASLGNHDDAKQRFYALFNLNGEEYLRFKKGDVSFYSLNSNYMDKVQLAWLTNELAKDDSRWKIAYFHHPPYSSGGAHGSSVGLRKTLEPIFIRYGINAVFAGHEHFYERVKPQNGIYYFITGAAGTLRKGDVGKNSALTAKAFDQDLSFMLVEVTENALHFQVISRTGQTVDSGAFPHPKHQ